ncbi:SDR family oxidoreductase [Halomonas sp. ISL-60]|uniref:SDR family oxidoreductase n=1 Tax=unclassified Halomonas TaxID=2609666 RepID=UPI0007D9D5B6|nr:MULTISPECIES: SDR family oxidoreductase [unclassified Halomonas]MBT2772404.1 SDR family oxidoreductase [Halomonas sp. ISL-60]MBT2786048.1 SDR family oxidoreductase [Halomonas sp. ISL-106]MBT2797070.1 SDR family oxidoreductase [Halomonas sp. ISL-104]MBT2803415.1 SDR family oxidoreductase [Halomonas sp. ISL-56]OAL58453.1 short-chain dehydrogenase [Halomonas sp. ALS9]
MTARLADKHILVTGAATGIGRAIAEACVREGAKVALLDREGDSVEQLAAQLRGEGHQAQAVVADIADRYAVEAAVARARKLSGPLTTLINNAGMNVFYEPLAMPDEAWQRCLSVDLEGAWYCSRAVMPDLLEQGGGAIVNIASTHSFSIIPGCFPYPVAKHGLIGLTRALGIEYASRGVRVNAIAPGYISTPAVEAHWQTFDDPTAAKARIEALLPPGRLGKPEEVAMTAVFLASDEAPFINASCITIDGGRSVVYHD